MEMSSVYLDAEQAAARYIWIESEKAGLDLGEEAMQRWVWRHWGGYLRDRWLEHLQGQRFWIELDRGDFGLLQREFRDHAVLLDRILDRLKVGQDNLDIIRWAHDWGIPVEAVLRILEALDINGRRLVHSFGPADAPVVKIDPAWLAWNRSAILHLARSIFEEKSFDLLPILGDALEEAGCADPVILEHCRACGRHTSWCWVVSLILGKS
jgi:hypothetical protein